MISQGGLVLRPGERVFLDRYFDIPNKFKFDTYEVANTEEVKQAIQDNGDVKVEFYREQQYNPYVYSGTLTLIGGCGTTTTYSGNIGGAHTFTSNCGGVKGLSKTDFSCRSASAFDGNTAVGATSSCNYVGDVTSASATLDMASLSDVQEPIKKDLEGARTRMKKAKSIETGRVEVGGASDQKFQTVNKNFDYFPFHTVEYKLLPISQKVNTSDDMKVKLYCTNCGAKMKPENKFCASCGTKA